MVFSVAAVAVALVGVAMVVQWVRLRRQGHAAPPNGLTVAAVFFTVAASLYWAGDVMDVDDPAVAWVGLVLPVLIAIVGVVPRQQLRWAAAILLIPFALLTGVSVGLAYLPAALVLVLAAALTPGTGRPEPVPEHRHVTRFDARAPRSGVSR